jgi:antitoxin (DNA-binding transcriptional repressor) of toxin-antitoxin stability system
MKASVVDLRYRMKEVLEAIKKNHLVELTYHGKVIATIVPSTFENRQSVKEHEIFGYSRDDHEPVEEKMKRMRKGRYRDL